MRKFFVIDIGVSNRTATEEVVRLRILNVYVLFALLALLPQLYLFQWSDWAVRLLPLLFSVAFAATWVFLARRARLGAKIWFYLCLYLYVFTTASIMGRDAGVQLALIPAIFGAILVIDVLRHNFTIAALVVLNIFTFVGLENTEYELLHTPIDPQHLSSLYTYHMILAISAALVAGVAYLYTYEQRLRQNRKIVREAVELEETISYFATSLFGKNTVEEVLWDVAKNCISRLGFEDCVVYLLDKDRNVLVQKAAYGPKNPGKFEILEPLELEVGEGIVGHVALTGQPLLVPDTSADERYVTDDARRMSELAVPLIYQDKVIGVIDSEHHTKDFYTQRHLEILQTVSALCANKVARALADVEREQAKNVQMEAEKIKAFDELKNKLFTHISHELRTPLTLIKGTIGRHLTQSDHTDWALLDNQTDRLLRLSNQLLDLTSVESGQYHLQPKPGEMSAFIHAIADQFAPHADEKNVDIEVEVSPTPLHLEFDRDAIEKILYNLVANAVRFAPPDTRLDIVAAYANGSLHLEVADSGPGIPEHVIHRVFDRFFRVDHAKDDGHGIGLALTSELVKIHRGHIKVQNRSTGGALFTVDLPLAPAKPPVGNDRSTPSLVAREDHSADDDRPLILIIEDNRDIREFIADILRDEYRILTAGNGLEALSAIDEHLPDLIVCDVMMPEMDGIEVGRRIRKSEITRHIPFLLLTAKVDRNSKLEGLQSGADDYLTKPFDPEELQFKVRNHLDRIKKLQAKYARMGVLPLSHISEESAEEKFIKRMAAIIDDKLGDPEFSVSALSTDLGVSRMQLHRKITAITGRSVGSFIRTRRLHRAAQLIGRGLSASEAAYDVGYSSLSHFSKVFKQEFGVSPSEYKSAPASGISEESEGG